MPYRTPITPDNISGLLQLNQSSIITLAGAGGKTSLIYMLAESFAAQGLRTLITTTTHIMKPSRFTDIQFVEQESVAAISEAFRKSPLVALGIPDCPAAGKTSDPAAHIIKWGSPSMDFLKNISGIPDRILCEGDGSRKMPVKLPRDGEPVFYPGTDTVIGVTGLSCLGQPARDVLFGVPKYLPNIPSGETGNRAIRFFASSGSLSVLPDVINIPFLEKLALSSTGLRKNVTSEKFLAIFNQADCLTPEAEKNLLKCAAIIKDNGTDCHIVSLKEKYSLII